LFPKILQEAPAAGEELSMARKVLIITRHYFPVNRPVSHRVANFAKYLPKFGWEPVVLCPKDTVKNYPAKYFDQDLLGQELCRTIRISYDIGSTRYLFERGVRRVFEQLSLHGLLFRSPRGLTRAMLKCVDDLLGQETFDVILATAPTALPLVIADEMSRKTQTPWVADFRDMPAQHKRNPGRFSPLHLDDRLHKKCCGSSSAMTSVSEPLVERLAGWHHKPVHLIYNGYDPGDYQKNYETAQDCFTMVYCGSIHDSADPVLLLDALDGLLKRDAKALKDFRVYFYGVKESLFQSLFAHRACSHLIHNKGRVPFNESIRAQQQASALLFLAYPAIEGVTTCKVFEYLGAGRPILSVPGDGGVTDVLLKETQAGVVGGTAEAISEILLGWLNEWRRTGTVSYQGREEEIAEYTRQKQTEKLAAVLDRVCRG